MMKFLMINCQKSVSLITKKEEEKLAWKENFQLALHLSMCRFCRLFERQSTFISRQIKNFFSTHKLLPEDKDRMAKGLKGNQLKVIFLLIFIFLPLTIYSQDNLILFREDFNDLNNWKPIYFPKIKRHTLYPIESYGDERYLKAESDAVDFIEVYK